MANHLDVLLLHDVLKRYIIFAKITGTMFHLSVAFGRVAIASFLLVVQAQTHLKTQYTLWAIAASNIIFVLPALFLTWFVCNPLQAAWEDSAGDNGPACGAHKNIDYAYFLGGA